MIWGHSSLIGPFGEVTATAGHEEATVICEIDHSMIQTIRHKYKQDDWKVIRKLL
uniref:CN hydrolase domain-containing protein n=1 Tax=Oryza meridionalis TaxID=40149 RepID=A0A0E0E1S7_9ORYZ